MDNNQLEWQAGQVDPIEDLIEMNIGRLQDYFLENNPEITKDKFEGHFDNWLSKLDMFDLYEILDLENYNDRE